MVFTLPTPDLIFEEQSESNINVAQSVYVKKASDCKYIEFKVSYVGTISNDQVARYIDYSGNTLLDGKIKSVDEISRDADSEKRIYKLMIYDYAYNLQEGNVNKTFDEQTAKARIQEVVEACNLNFVDNFSSPTSITLAKRTYSDLKPLSLVNNICEALGASWRVDENNFYLYRSGGVSSTDSIDENSGWIKTSGWTDDASEKATKVVIKGATITQSATETFAGSQTQVTLLRKPVDIFIDGLTQTTTNIDGDYTVTENVVDFDSSQTDPTVEYSYESQLRVEVGDEGITKVLSKKYITSIAEARRLGRNYLNVYGDGVSSSKWATADISKDVDDFVVGSIIDVTNKISTDRDGQYIVASVKREYPKKITIAVGENTTSIYDWQKESKQRIEELEQQNSSSDFTTQDVFKQIKLNFNYDLDFTHIFTVQDSGNILFASDTTLASDGDLISDTGADEDFALAYDDDDISSLPEYTSYL